MGKRIKLNNSKLVEQPQEENPRPAPQLARRKLNRNSTLRLGRTIGEKRERLETANEREAARKKDKRKQTSRVLISSLVFLGIIVVLIVISINFVSSHRDEEPVITNDAPISFEPTIEIVDESASATGGKITSRMKEYIGQVESGLKFYGYQPTKAVIPSSSVREVDFYISDHPGFIKTVTDRGAGVTTEDADRVIRYLKDKDITDYSYIDVRIDGKAYWK